MSTSVFLSCDQGYAELLGALNWATSPIAACLVDAAAGASLVRTGANYGDIKGAGGAHIKAAIALPSPDVSVASEHVCFKHAKAMFTESGSLAGRYVVYVAGNHASLGDSDKVIGYVDLTGDGNVASVSAEFSFTPDATHGLFKIGRTVSL